jgi:hypothetical protein
VVALVALSSTSNLVVVLVVVFAAGAGSATTFLGKEVEGFPHHPP